MTMFQKVLDPGSRLEGLLAGADRDLQRAFLLAVSQMKDQLTLRQIELLIDQGRVQDALDLASRAFTQFSDRWITTYVSTAQATGDFITDRVAAIVSFDQTNTFAVSNMQRNRLRLIREFSVAQREATSEALVRGVAEGINPRQQAIAFRDSLGLTQSQERIIANYRRNLEENDLGALRRRLRDRRFDSVVRRSIRDGEPLSRTQIDRMVGRYRERWVKFRSEVIARTESLRSTHEGSEEMYRQAINDGTLDPETLTRIWNTARDERVRGSHRSMHNQQVAFDEPFISGDGNALMRPGDFDAPAEETIQCRCVVATRFKANVEAAAGIGVA